MSPRTRSKARQEKKSLRLYFIDQHHKLGQTLVGVYNNVPRWRDEVFVHEKAGAFIFDRRTSLSMPNSLDNP